MSKREDKNRKPLTLEETVRLFGSEQPVDLGPVQLDPLGMQFLATRVGELLKRGQGRPTDKSWDISRKIPMKQETWDALKQIAEQIGGGELRVAAGQMGAYALEIGVESLRHRPSSFERPKFDSFAPLLTLFPEEIQAEAKKLAPIIRAKAIW